MTFQPNKIIGFFHGIDPATQGDYYVDVVHVLTEKPRLINEEDPNRYKWLPFMVDIMRLKHRDPNEIVDLQIRMFNKYPPHLTHIDASREDFLAGAYIRKYGESKIIPIKFTNSGSSNVKFKLKQVGFSYIDSGYNWPDPFAIEKTHPRLAKLIKILKKEMLHEQVEHTPSGRITFNHPIGKHNDIVHGWELSLEAVMEFQQRNLGYQKRRTEEEAFQMTHADIYADYPTEEIEEDEVFDRVGKSFALN